MTTKSAITKRLLAIGACWANTMTKCVLPDDGFGARPTYHIHPYKTEPWSSNVLRFRNLQEIEDYLDAREAAAKLEWDDPAALDIMDAWAYGRDR